MKNQPQIERLESRFAEVPVFLELVPPRRKAAEKIFRKHVRYLRELQSVTEINAINLPEIQEEDGKGERGKRKNSFKERIPPRKYARKLRDVIDTRFIINRVIVKQPPEFQEEWLIQTQEDYDIRDVVLVGGEASSIEYPGPSVTEGNTLVKKFLNEGLTMYQNETVALQDFLVGNICIPTRRQDDFDEPERILAKIKSGADFFTTQITMEPHAAANLLRDLSSMLQGTDLIPPYLIWSFTPVAQQKDVDFLRWLGVYLPDEVESGILGSKNPAEESILWAKQIWESLREIQESLPRHIPMGYNISVIGLRNFSHAIRMAEEFEVVAKIETS